MSFAASGATKLVLGSAAGIAKDDKLMIPGTATATAASAFLEAATGSGSCYSVTAVSGNTVTISPGLKAEAAAGTAVTKSTACGVSASPSPGPAFGASELKLFKVADLTQTTTLPAQTTPTCFKADGTTAQTVLNVFKTPTAAVAATGTATPAAATGHAFSLSFTPAAKIAKDSFVVLTFGDNKDACSYESHADANTAALADWASSSNTGFGILDVGKDASNQNFASFGAAGSVIVPQVGTTGTGTAGPMYKLKAKADIAAGTKIDILVVGGVDGGGDAASANKMVIKTPPTANKCAANDVKITLSVVDSASKTVAGPTAVTKSPA